MKMRCSEVQEKLPEYLAGVLDENTKAQIGIHLKACSVCSAEMSELNRDVSFNIGQLKDANENRIIKKTKTKFNLAIIRTVSIIIVALLLISMLPVFLWGIQSVLNQTKASRALMDFVQFTQPNEVNAWGNSAVNGLTLSVPLKIGTRFVVGRESKGQAEIIGKMSVINGKVTVPDFLGASFVHPELFAGADFGSGDDIAAQTKILEKNAKTTVATVDYSLKKVISLTDVENLLAKYDIQICWMAVEAGIEDLKPRNMTMENQQVLQWGIPGKLSKPGKFYFAELKSGNANEFEIAVKEELQWLDDNKGILRPDPDLLKNNGIDNSVKSQAQYIHNNGIKIYGLRITGPTEELIKLTRELDPRTMTVVEMDFWNW